MKPVSYQSMPPAVNGGHQNLALDRVLTTSNVMYCEKCGFASVDAAVFKKHMVEHMGTRFYCFYCNNVSFSEAELNAHLKQHTSKYPFVCPHCGQGYMRRLCLVKHIERLHSKRTIQGPAKPGMALISHVPVSTALSSVSTADHSSLGPAVRLTAPASTAPAVRLGKEEERRKTLDTNLTHATNGNTELFPPLNGLMQHHRALTVSLPEEVTIPAGCLVELVEVKTVNGTKELKLRLVSQQENESVIKDTRNTVPQNNAVGKLLSTTLNHQSSPVKSVSMGMCTVNRKQCETKMVNVERPVVPVSISKNLHNHVSKEKSAFKRPSQEIINLECNTVIPNKIPKMILGPVREGQSGIRVAQREHVNCNAAPPPVISNRGANRLTSTLHPEDNGTSVSQRAVEERKNLISEHPKSFPAQRAADKSILRDVSVAVKLEPAETHLRNNTAPKTMKGAVGLNQQRLKSGSVPLAAATLARPPAILACKDNVANQSLPAHRTLNGPSSVRTSVLSNHTNSKISAWIQGVRSSERAGGDVSEPESFPIISSVFSLSQQPEEVQGSIQPLMMALHGIVMDKTNSSGGTRQGRIKITNGTEPVMEPSTSRVCAQVATKDKSVICDPLLTERVDPVKVVLDKGVQGRPALTDHQIHVKTEKNSTTPTDNNNKSSHTPASESSPDQGSVPTAVAHVGTSVSPEAPTKVEKSERAFTTKFLTVSLKRVQVGVWKKSRKGLKLRISKYKTHLPVDSLTDCAVIYPTPLKEDQLVKRPGPNQPVVVLNHPKPRGALQGARADTVADTGASEVVPKCQILKMRLSKVVGQKYEVMGCTVGVFP
ncbi:putative zinc finger protein 518B [Scophthalmus maximus]|uniref:Putative zinc finger protein 518B n=1 Tax=Scophthalmus maximus TaxID=52904 RepID=A0A2U9C5D8_SCOMX|nr:uncharacterized protein LOC118319522 [Scophthalmus maximus]AWP11795.1 putative zinc finger protein 518B [Scophthalmus maximus]